MDVNDTISDLKNKILEAGRMNRTATNQSLSSMVLTFRNQQELQETRLLREYRLSDGAKINVIFRLSVHVMSVCRTMRSHVDVNDDDELLALRTACQRSNRESNFPLPADGRYFFIDKGVAMQEERSDVTSSFTKGSPCKKKYLTTTRNSYWNR
ncbi:hypothetical protein L484_013902 [Morus notabilis]|uniref:Ubiquitin-like domain-containing protein n=1 Tax=Morus notabilis TaxID=981085 RepID=W9QVY2_9ROSA|nr:hypothetical protein L484_013902 [Morus notabilis]